jgi:hypothetical protein
MIIVATMVVNRAILLLLKVLATLSIAKAFAFAQNLLAISVNTMYSDAPDVGRKPVVLVDLNTRI